MLKHHHFTPSTYLLFYFQDCEQIAVGLGFILTAMFFLSPAELTCYSGHGGKRWFINKGEGFPYRNMDLSSHHMGFNSFQPFVLKYAREKRLIGLSAMLV